METTSTLVTVPRSSIEIFTAASGANPLPAVASGTPTEGA